MKMILAVFALSFANLPFEEGQPERENAVWRTGPNHDVICLTYYLKLFEKEVSFDEIVRSKRERYRFSMNEVVRIAKKFDMDLEIGKLDPSMNGLPNEKLPVLALCDGDQRQATYFVVILNRQGNDLTVFDGPTATIETVPISEFLRNWNGMVIFPAEPDGQQSLMIAGIVALSYLTLLIGIAIRNKFRNQAFLPSVKPTGIQDVRT